MALRPKPSTRTESAGSMAGSKLYGGVAVADPYYSSGADLKAKNELAATEGPDVPAWALAHIDLASLTTALDVGAGWGRFGGPLLERAESLRYLVCADISPGMLATCRSTLADARRPALFVACDVRLLPFPPASFEVVMANHMLYELAEPAVAAVELARVLKREGTLVATAYSDQVRVHLIEFHRAALAELGLHPPPEPPASFSLDNGARVLGQAFHHVEVDTLEDLRRLDPGGSPRPTCAAVATYLSSGARPSHHQPATGWRRPSRPRRAVPKRAKASSLGGQCGRFSSPESPGCREASARWRASVGSGVVPSWWQATSSPETGRNVLSSRPDDPCHVPMKNTGVRTRTHTQRRVGAAERGREWERSPGSGLAGKARWQDRERSTVSACPRRGASRSPSTAPTRPPSGCSGLRCWATRGRM